MQNTSSKETTSQLFELQKVDEGKYLIQGYGYEFYWKGTPVDKWIVDSLATEFNIFIKQHNLEGIEKEEATDYFFEYIKKMMFTENKKLRSFIRVNATAEYYDFIVALTDAYLHSSQLIRKQLQSFLESEKSRRGYITNNSLANMKSVLMLNDDDYVKTIKQLMNNKVDFRDLYRALNHEARNRLLFEKEDGEAMTLILFLSAIWVRYGRPDSFDIARNDFLRELGVTYSGSSLVSYAEKLKAKIYSWAAEDPIKVLAPADKTNGILDFSADVRLPVMTERRIKFKGSVNRIIWHFENFDPILFPRDPQVGYTPLYTRPLRHITSKMGTSSYAAIAKKAVVMIEAATGTNRKHPFKMQLSTLGLTSKNFGRHSEHKNKAIETVKEALQKVDIGFEIGDGVAIITPNIGGGND